MSCKTLLHKDENSNFETTTQEETLQTQEPGVYNDPFEPGQYRVWTGSRWGEQLPEVEVGKLSGQNPNLVGWEKGNFKAEPDKYRH